MRKLVIVVTLMISILCGKYIYQKFGNVFYMSYALNSAKKICEKEYASMLYVTGYGFDEKCNSYIIDVSDINGINARMIYSGGRTLQDEYFEKYMSVQKNIIRGKYQKMVLNDSEYEAFCNVIPKQYKKGIIGLETDFDCKELYIDFGDVKSLNDLAAKTLKAYESVCDEDFKYLSTTGNCNKLKYEFRSNKKDIPKRASDIEKRIIESK